MSKKISGEIVLDSRGKFQKGHKKLGGKKKGTRHLSVVTREALEEAIRISDKTHDKTLLMHFIEEARKNPHVLIALMKKLLADKKEVDTHVEGSLEMLLKEIENEAERGLPSDRKNKKENAL